MESSSRGASLRASELRGRLYELALLFELTLDRVAVRLLFAGRGTRGLALGLLRLAIT